MCDRDSTEFSQRAITSNCVNEPLAIMKYTFTFFAALLLVGASALPVSNNDDDTELNELDRDIEDFYRLIPLDKLEKVIDDHKDDPELHKTIKYLYNESFHNLVYVVEDLPEFQKYVLYLQAAGYNAIRDLRLHHKILGMKDYVPPKPTNEEDMAAFRQGGGFNGYIEDLIAILPRKEIQALHAKKVKESPAFAKFKNAVVSPKFAQIRAALYAQEPFQRLVIESRINGFDFMKIYIFRSLILGFM